VVIEGYYSFKKAESFNRTNKHNWVWVEEITDGHREIYVRCVGCHNIFKVSDRMGTRSTTLKISSIGAVTPCLTCPHWSCSAHMFATLEGYEYGKAKDVFGS
jgi:hypothetical protein